ncbi:hypothetical protein ebA5361 [Aromatoleum aromaticum EbN1]|uniref:Uncharacterized protein n=1 Tax=Aromatoleum aromaticum (strain DSM 19018 / LMG 30748 / EbN1) TaxID=76114 RepID=Q5P0J6_AROAE|nr:hypothetical protein ebA5361 [Aromatoleum aromaticum EbN1]
MLSRARLQETFVNIVDCLIFINRSEDRQCSMLWGAYLRPIVQKNKNHEPIHRRSR